MLYQIHISKTVPYSSVIGTPCKYFTSEELSASLKKEAGFKLLNLNIVSLDKNFNKLSTMLSTIDTKFDFITLSEIGKKNIPSRAIMLKQLGYESKFEMPTLARGGVGLLFNENIDLVDRPDLKITPNIIKGKKLEVENIWYQTKSVNPKHDYIIGVIYRHPGGTVDCLTDFSDQLKETMSKINTEKTKCIIAGDLNIDGLKIENSNPTKYFFNNILEENFIPSITLPTRITETSVTLIDHLLINEEVIKSQSDILTGNLFEDISDHLPNFIFIKHAEKSKNQKRKRVRIFGDTNMAEFNNKLRNSDWNRLLEIKDETEIIDEFYKIWNKSYNQAFPFKNVSRKRSKDKKWITTGLKISIRHKNRLYKKYLLNPTITNKLKYNSYKNKLTSCIKNAEADFYKKN